MIEQIQIKKDNNLTHKRVLEINYKGEVFTFKATNIWDKFPNELIEEFAQLASEMQDHNELMDIRNQERK